MSLNPLFFNLVVDSIEVVCTSAKIITVDIFFRHRNFHARFTTIGECESRVYDDVDAILDSLGRNKDSLIIKLGDGSKIHIDIQNQIQENPLEVVCLMGNSNTETSYGQAFHHKKSVFLRNSGWWNLFLAKFRTNEWDAPE